jgi:hypothetical protein
MDRIPEDVVELGEQSLDEDDGPDPVENCLRRLDELTAADSRAVGGSK